MSGDIRPTPEVRNVGIPDLALGKNGDITDSAAAVQAVNFMYGLQMRRGRVLYSNQKPVGSYFPSGTVHRARCASGYYSSLYCTVVYADSGVSGLAGFATFNVDGVSHLSRIADFTHTATAAAGPGDLKHVTFKLSPVFVAGGFTTDIDWSADANAAINSVVIFEGITASSSDLSVLAPVGRYSAGAQIVDSAPLGNIVGDGWTLHLNKSTSHFTWSGSFALGSTTFTNLLDSSTAGYSSSAAGFWSIPQYQASMTGTTVPCKFWVYASSTGTTGQVRVRNSTGVLATITGITAAGYYSADITLDPTMTASDLLVVEVREATAAKTITVTGCGVYNPSS